MFGAEAALILGSGSRLKIKSPTGEKKTSLIIKPGKEGFNISKTRTGACKIGSKSLVEWLFKKGMALAGRIAEDKHQNIENVLQKVVKALEGLEYGEVVIKVRGGKVVSIKIL